MPDDPDTAAEQAARFARAVATVSGWLARLIDPDQVVELRALKMHDGTPASKGGGYTAAGTFRGDELPLMAKEALQLSGLAHGVYYTLNPLKPERYDRRAPRVRKVGHGETAEDQHVLTRRWLLIDIDPVRTDPKHKKDSATDAEKAAAWAVLLAVREYLNAEGWSPPVVSDSGNGYHLLYKIAGEGSVPKVLPTPDDDSMRKVLLHLADKFDTAAAKIDTVTFNPARIVKLPGTLACKGVATEDRPHRRARLVETPE